MGASHYNIAINGSIEITSTAFYITLPILATWLLSSEKPSGLPAYALAVG